MPANYWIVLKQSVIGLKQDGSTISKNGQVRPTLTSNIFLPIKLCSSPPHFSTKIVFIPKVLISLKYDRMSIPFTCICVRLKLAKVVQFTSVWPLTNSPLITWPLSTPSRLPWAVSKWIVRWCWNFENEEKRFCTMFVTMWDNMLLHCERLFITKYGKLYYKLRTSITNCENLIRKGHR